MESNLEKLLYVALGSALSVKERIDQGSEEAKAHQAKLETAAREFIDELGQRGEKEKHQLEEMLRKHVKQVIEELDLATKADLEKLKEELRHGQC